MTDQNVETFAEFPRRLAAFLVDAVILVGVVAVTVFIPGTVLVFFGKSKGAVMASTYIFGIVFFLLYFSLMESSIGQATIGKRLVGICVGNIKGRPLSLQKAFVRTCGKSVPLFVFVGFSEIVSRVEPYFENAGLLILIPVLIAGLWFLPMWFTPKGQAAHDMMAGSVVFTSEK